MAPRPLPVNRKISTLYVVDVAQAQRRSGWSVRTPGGWGFSYGDRGYGWGNWGYGGYSRGYPYGWDGRYGYGRYGWDGYRYSVPYTGFYRSYYSDPGSSYAPTYVAPMGSLNVEVHVPRADATVWINGRQSTQTGMTRHFTVREIYPGQTYSYEVRASWNDDGRPITQVRSASGQAGDTLQVVFDGLGS